MEYRYLGTSGLKISALSFGSWVTFGNQIDNSVAYDCMVAAYDAGVNFFDNAEVYAAGKSETVMGEVLRKTQWSRDSYLVSTKIFWGGEGPNQRGLSRKHIVEGTNASLRRLGLDYVDLIYCHRPDVHTPIEETVRAMNHVIDKGQAFYWGTSEWSAEQIMQAHAVARREHLIPPLMEQPQYHMFHRERVEVEYKRLYDEVGMGTTTWSPLAGGVLSGKYKGKKLASTRSSMSDLSFLSDLYEGDAAEKKAGIVQKLSALAADLSCSMAQLALAWCLKNPHVSSVITGASKLHQVQENMKAIEVCPKLDAEVLKRIETILGNAPAAAPDMR